MNGTAAVLALAMGWILWVLSQPTIASAAGGTSFSGSPSWWDVVADQPTLIRFMGLVILALGAGNVAQWRTSIKREERHESERRAEAALIREAMIESARAIEGVRDAVGRTDGHATILALLAAQRPHCHDENDAPIRFDPKDGDR